MATVLENYWNVIKGANNAMWSNSPKYYILIVVSIIIVLVCEKNHEKKIMFGWYPLVMYVLFYNPILVPIASCFFGDDIIAYYCRFMLMIPIFLIISYAVILVAERQKKEKRIIFLFIAFIIIYGQGFSAYGEEGAFSKMENFKNIPEDVVELNRILDEDAGQGYKHVCVPYEISMYVRQFDPSIIVKDNPSCDVNSSSYFDECIEYMRSNECDYWLCDKSFVKAFKNKGAILVGKTDNYAVFKDDYHSPHREYDICGRKIREFYCDEKGNLVVLDNGVTYTEWVYDKAGYNTEILYKDADGNLVVASTGYASVKYTYDNKGRLLSEYYYDENSKPVPLEFGQYGRMLMYDDDNHLNAEKYVNSEGELILTTKGYAEVCYYDFDSNGNFNKEMYFDENERPICNGYGFAGVKYNRDDDGYIIKETFLGEDGGITKHILGYYVLGSEYDNEHRLIKNMYYDNDGKLIDNIYGYAGINYYDFDDMGNALKERYFDSNGNLVVSYLGYAGIDYTIDTYGRIICYKYVDEFGEVVNSINGYAYHKIIYDENGKLIKNIYIDSEGKEKN